MVWDVTCPDTLAPSHLNRAVTGPGAVATFAEDNKSLKYAEISRTYIFVPIAVETMGAVGEEGLTFLKELGARIRTVTKERRSFDFLMQRFSVAIQRGNAACILGTLHSASDLDDIYYLFLVLLTCTFGRNLYFTQASHCFYRRIIDRFGIL